MLTAFDKAIAGGLMAALVTLNQKYGFHFDVGPDTQSVLTSLIDAALNGMVGFFSVYYASNKGP
jgi:hypothetical protein